MPVNENLPKVVHKSSKLLDTTIDTHYKMLEENIKVSLLDGSYMTWEQLKQYIPLFVDATWGIDINKPLTDAEREDIVMRMFKGEHLPGSLKTFRFTFLVEGMSYIGVTHYLRHEGITFSAVCTGDRPLLQDNYVIPEALWNSPEIMEKVENGFTLLEEAYKEAVDSQKVSTMDARYILPRCMEQKYFMSMDWITLLKVIKQRLDRAIQPKEDNLIAMYMWDEILKIYPQLKDFHLVDIDQENKFYQLNARKERSTNLYLPEPQDDKFEYRLDDFVYNKTREELNGTLSIPKSVFMRIYLDLKKRWL